MNTATIIAIFIWILSGLSIIFLVFKKRIELAKLSEKNLSFTSFYPARTINFAHLWQKISFATVLEKSLLKIRILILKTENKINIWLERLRRKPIQPKDKTAVKNSVPKLSKLKDKDYWNKLR